MELDHIRQQIDLVDKDLVALLEKRMQLVTEVSQYKKEKQQPVLDSVREQTVLKKAAAYVENKEFENSIVSIFSDIMKHSRAYQTSKLEE
ncbi:chorismate mutase [Streptococcus sp. H49]|uniref:chorismate mutase n=1 Tax=Streptococcus huangxiaojuni TaxID=3237239 RepID=UPI0034A4CEEF